MAPQPLGKTQDPSVFIEERRPGYVRYRSHGQRWEVHGECIGLGYCIVGAVIDGREIETLKEARRIWREHRFELDSPIAPGFAGCCPLEVRKI